VPSKEKESSLPRIDAPSNAESHKTLGGYLDSIRKNRDEFRSVSRPVNPMNFDVTAILQKLEDRREFPVVEFRNPLNMHGDPSEFPIVSNLWATRERCADAVGVPRSEAGPQLGVRFSEMVGNRLEPRLVSSDNAPVQAHVYRGDDADMFRFPVVKHAEMDLGGATTMALAMHEPGDDFYNVSFIKAFPEPGGRAGLTIHSKDMGRMTKAWERRGEPFPVVNILGAHPGFWLGTLNNTPYGDNEYATIGGFIREPLRLAPSVTWGKDFLVPADAEIIIEGEITPGDHTVVDPFGEISGLYQEQQLAPVMRVTAITHRDGAVYQDVFSGHREHMLLGSIPIEGSIYLHLQRKLGIVHAVHMPYSACGRYTAYISIHKTEEYQGKQAGLQALANSPNLHTAVVVDDNINVFNEEEVIWAANTYVNPARDVDVIRNSSHNGEPSGLGYNRVIIDATRTSSIATTTRLRVPPSALARIELDDWLDSVEGDRR
jgi:2,5-furandicarboxylate decarboxylase 1